MFDLIVKNVPVLSQTYGVTRTAMRIYNSTSPVGAVKAAVKGVLVDCAPPVVKYPLKCIMLASHIALCATTGSPLACSLAIGFLDYMLDDGK